MNSLPACLDGFLAATAGDVSKSTFAWYEKRLRAFVGYAGDVCPNALTPTLLRAYKAKLVKDELSPHTIHGHQRAVRRFCSWLVEEGVIPRNVARDVPLVKLPQSPPKAVTDDDLERLLKRLPAESARDRAIVLFLVDTGCRVGGLCSLTLDAVDLAHHCAVVVEKGTRGRRVYYTEMTAAALSAYLAARAESDEPALFLAEKGGGALGTDGVRQMLRRVGKRARVKGRINPHAFRHAFARWYLRNGGNLPMLGRTLGHRPGSPVTARYYAIFEDGELQEFHGRYSPLASRNGASGD